MKLNNYLTILKELGAGSSGTVYLCNYQKENFSKKVAVKKFMIPSEDQNIYSEAEICSMLIHPNIVQIFNTEKDFDGYLLLIYEYIEGVSLRAYLESKEALPLEESIYIYNSLLSGLEFLQKNKIIHHDFSPRNIILGIHGEVKILDFGLSKVKSSIALTEDSHISGTISYYDPYLVQTHSPYDEKADLYALNLIFYELLTGTKFFNAHSTSETLTQLKEFKGLTNDDLDLIENEKLKIFFKKNLSLDRDERFTIDEVKHFINIFPSRKIEALLAASNESKTVSIIDTRKSKNKFGINVSLIYPLLIATLTVVFLLLYKNSPNQDVFYVRQENTTYRAIVPEELSDSKTYSEISQQFNKKSCEYFYFSFITSIMLLDEKYATSQGVKKINKEFQNNFVKKLYNLKPLFDSFCARSSTNNISKKLNSLEHELQKNISLGNSDDFSYLKKEFESNYELINSYEEATKWLSSSYFNVSILLDTDIFKDERIDSFNLDSCTLYSEYSFIYKLLNSKTQKHSNVNFNVIGMAPKNKIEIYGKLKSRILFNLPSHTDFKDYNYCFYTYKNSKIKIYFGKLKYAKLDN